MAKKKKDSEKNESLDNENTKSEEVKTTLIHTLRELFQFDKNELDFGIYRILNIKKKEISNFIERELFEIIEQQIKTPIDSKNIQEQQDMQSEEEIFDHIINFFSRYFDNGDFISKRRYSKENKYAIPYNGEEVYLYWANNDQYYIKTTEIFNNYSFKAGSWKINFEITSKDVDLEKANIKDPQKKYFIFYDLKSTAGNILIIYFGYRGLTEEEENAIKKNVGKKTINNDYVNKYNLTLLQKKLVISTIPELREIHRKMNGELSNITKLEWHLSIFTTKNSSDYFIHKDLKGFLSRELDFYIKNEIFEIDNIATLDDLNFNLKKIKVLKNISLKIINFLAQIEDFQKKIWEKKKFILSTEYLITLDYIDEINYSVILKNKAQIEEWKKNKLFIIEEGKNKKPQKTIESFGKTKQGLNINFLKNNPTLTIDTKFFDDDFKYHILSEIKCLDDNISGILINSDNYNALNLLTQKFKERIKSCYIDPPFNSKSTEIMYKNNYRDSSWISFVFDRIKLSSLLLKDEGIIAVAIDDYEIYNLKPIMDYIFNSANRLGTCVVIHNPGGRQDDRFFPTAHEYMLFYGKNIEQAELGRLDISEEKRAQYKNNDKYGRYKLRGFRRSGANSRRIDRPNLWYSIYIDPKTFEITSTKKNDFLELLPIDGNGIERCWRWGQSTFEAKKEKYIEIKKKNGNFSLFVKEREEDNLGEKVKTIWQKSNYSAVNGTTLLKNLFGLEKESLFSFPKSPYLIQDILRIMNFTNEFIIDFFAGSGTTGHACLSLNKIDGGNRKFILVEIGHHFDTVIKPRMIKAIYSENWKKGQPQDNDGSRKQIIKYHYLEQYEDSLKNIDLKIPNPLALKSKNYKIKYMLDFETKESNIFLNLDLLDNPFEYYIDVENNLETKKVKIDLVETFNYIAGVFVHEIYKKQDNDVKYLVVIGKRDDKKVVIIWRDKNEFFIPERDKEFIEKEVIKDEEYDEIFVNGGSLVEKAISLDVIFKKCMLGE